MSEPLNMMLACCVLNRKRLIAELKQLPSGGKLEFTVDNTEVIKKQIQKVLEEESCRVIETVNENGETRVIIEKRV